MTIETKFELGDGVYYLDSNVVTIGKVSRVCVDVTSDVTSISYILSGSCSKIPERLLFPTKQELKDSL